MAISATLELEESGGIRDVLPAFLTSLYTVLDLDYSIERTCDKTGRPTGGASISFITVTIRAAKQADVPFHNWINDPDLKMNGTIRIYDSAGILSSSIQDGTGVDPLVDWDDAFGIPEDMMEGAMNEAMDQASDYGPKEPDMYEEMSHEDLVDVAKSLDIEIKKGESDDEIREAIRTEQAYKKIMTDDNALKEYMQKHSEIEWPSYDTNGKKLNEMEAYMKEKGITPPKEKTADAYKKAIQDYLDAETLKLVKKDDVKKDLQNKRKQETLENKAFTPAYQAADKLKKQTSSTAKGLVKDSVKKIMECARVITFKNAYCIHLKEHFTNKPDSQGKLDTSYPWTLEIGIKPQTVKVQGEKVLSIAGKGTTFDLY